MNILITGASGFIGQHLLKDINTEHHNVTLLTRNPDLINRASLNNVKIVVADLTDYYSLEKAFKNIEVIINIAAEVRNIQKLALTNVLGTENLVKAAFTNHVKKIIHMSSVGVVGKQYSSTSVTINENSECHPKNEYEKTKYKSEQILIKACASNNIELRILRPTNVFGEKHPHDALLKLMKHIQQNKMIVLAPNAIVNYVYVKDLTAAIIKLLDAKASQIINIGYAIKYIELVTLLNKILKRNTKVIVIPNVFFKLLNAIGIHKLNVISNHVAYEDSKFKSFFNYPFGLEKGMENTYQFFKQKGDLK